VIFRTAGEQSILEGRVDEPLLSRWTYIGDRSQELNLKDRSAIYGGFHIYELNA
jgi:S-adenosylmethionine-diacylglycerol 3-amino-3-carboxypropyl transferase